MTAAEVPPVAREAILQLLLDRPNEEWTIASVIANLPDGITASLDAVEQLFWELMHECLMEPVPFQRDLTVRLSAGAQLAVRLRLRRSPRRPVSRYSAVPDRN